MKLGVQGYYEWGTRSVLNTTLSGQINIPTERIFGVMFDRDI